MLEEQLLIALAAELREVRRLLAFHKDKTERLTTEEAQILSAMREIKGASK